MTKTKKQKIGNWGEEQASLFLLREGYEILEKNYFARGGEIDIIALDKNSETKTICFVEVKTRKKDDGSAERALSSAKAKKLKIVAKDYFCKNELNPDDFWIRFELLSVYYDNSEQGLEIKKYIIPSWMFA